jgi:hypothetical protein
VASNQEILGVIKGKLEEKNEVIREQQEQILDLQGKIGDLENKVEALEALESERSELFEELKSLD